jgi:formylglycine-generating enzyme required for sulfatase activity
MRHWALAAGFLIAVVGRLVSAQEPPPGMALVPAGEYWQGRIYRTLIEELDMHARARIDDLPAHLVYVDAFFIDKFEVSNAEYLKFVEGTARTKPWHWRGGKYPEGKDKFPVYNVSWDDAAAYCGSVGMRLPTEAEWEKAARGGTDRLRYPWGDQLLAPLPSRRGGGPPNAGTAATAAPNRDDPGAAAPDPASAAPNRDDPGTAAPAAPQARGAAPAVPVGGRRGGGVGTKMAHYGVADGPVAVGSYPPNAFGIFDMVGNVGEWVQDWYSVNYYSISPERNPKGPESGMYRVIRGDTWAATDERNLAVNYRQFGWQTTQAPTIGFRCAQSVSTAPSTVR